MIVWAIIGLLMVVISFISDRVINTNCRYIYSGSLTIIVGCLVGMSGRPVIAASIVVFGCLVVMRASIHIVKKRYSKDYKRLK